MDRYGKVGQCMNRCQDVWKGMKRYGKVQTIMDRYGKVGQGMNRCRDVWKGIERYVTG